MSFESVDSKQHVTRNSNLPAWREREMLISISKKCIRFRGYTGMNLEETGQKVQTSSSSTVVSGLHTSTWPDVAVHYFAAFPSQAIGVAEVSASVLSQVFKGYMSRNSIFSLSFTGSPSRVT